MDEKKSPNIDLLFFGRNCNLNCNHCYCQEGSGSIKKTDIKKDIEIARKVQQKNPDSKVYLYPKEIATSIEASELFREFGQKQILTNGVVLSDRIVQALKESGIERVKTTLFGDYESHALLYNITFQQYLKIIENIDRYVKEGFRVVVNTVITRSNITSIKRLIKICCDLGVSEISFLRLRPTGNARSMDQNEFLRKKDIIKTVELIETIKQNKPPMYLSYNMSFGPDFFGKSSRQAQEKTSKNKLGWKGEKKYICPIIDMNYLGVSMRSGDVFGCLFAMEENDFKLGKLDFTSGKITLFEKDFMNSGILSANLRGNCQKDACPYHDVCMGGCRSLAYVIAKEKGEKNPIYAGMDYCITKIKEEIYGQKT